MTAAATRLSVVQPERLAGLVIRVSTDRQALNDEGSLKNQLQRLRQHIDYKQQVAGETWSEAAVYELRAVSGKDSMRSKEFERLFADIRAGRINTIVCTALDRICRSVRDFLHFFEVLAEHNVEFVCLKQQYDTTTPQGKLFVTIMMALAEFEREQTAERTREAVAARSARGLWNGGRLLGYDLNANRKGYLVPNPQESAIVNFAFDAYLECGSIVETVHRLNAEGYRTKAYKSRREVEHAPREFYTTTVQHLLKNASYIGKKATSDGSLVDAVWPGIVDPEKFDRVQQLMARNGRANRSQAKVVRHVHVLSHGLLLCGRCGADMKGRSGTGRLGTTYFYYACPSKPCGLRVVASEVERAVICRIGQLASAPETLERITEKANLLLQRRRPELEKRQAGLQRSLRSVERESGGLARALGRATDDAADALNQQLTTVGVRRRQLEDALVAVRHELVEIGRAAVSAGRVADGLRNFHRVFPHLKAYEQRELVRLVVKQATLTDRELVLELYGGALESFEGDEKANPGRGFAAQPIWLPDEDSNLEHSG
jgi:site-specific DNA recombinase